MAVLSKEFEICEEWRSDIMLCEFPKFPPPLRSVGFGCGEFGFVFLRMLFEIAARFDFDQQGFPFLASLTGMKINQHIGNVVGSTTAFDSDRDFDGLFFETLDGVVKFEKDHVVPFQQRLEVQ